MVRWAEEALARVEQEGVAAIVTVCGADGSTPRETGAKMVIGRSGQWGSVGGGNLEHQATDQARRLLDKGGELYLLQDYPLGPLLGQCCGGYVRVLIETAGEDSRGWLKRVRAAGGETLGVRLVKSFASNGMVETQLAGETGGSAPAPIQLTDEHGRPHSGRRVDRAACRGAIEHVAPERRALVLFGAGHVGVALAHILRLLPFDVVWRDDRSDIFPDGTGDGFELRPIGEPDAAVAASPPEAFYLVMTHNHDLDYRLVRAILARDDVAYCGLIGSKTKRARFERRLKDDGVAEERLAQLICPIGEDGPKSKAPETIAVATAAEILRVAEAGHGR